MNRTLALVSMLIVGCMAGATTAKLVAPTAQAAGSARWEYLCKDDLEGHDKGFSAGLNELGADGWEMVTATHDRGANYGYSWMVCFKRPAM
jgi:hypothetical protein